MKTLYLFLVLLLASTNVQAKECDINLKETDNYQNLNIILNCLSGKIENLEKELRLLEESGGGISESKQPSAILDNQYLTVYNYKISRKDDKIFLSFVVKNKYDKDIYIALLNRSPIITYDDGVALTDYWVFGLKDVFDNEKNESQYSVLNPGVPTPVSIQFHNVKSKGKEVAFKVGLKHLIGDKKISYSFGLSKITLEN